MSETQSLSATREALLAQIVDPAWPKHINETPLSPEHSLRIGRQAGVHLMLEEGSVSREHAQIIYAGGNYLLQDLGSTNGTFVNEQRLSPARPYVLQANDVLRFGNIIRMQFLVRTTSYSSRIPSPRSAESKQIVGEASPSSTTQRDYAELDEPELQRTTGLAVLNADGTLSAPGGVEPLPALMVAQLQKAPALVITDSSAPKGTIPEVHFLNPGKRTKIGREKDNDIVLTDPAISRHHAEVYMQVDGFYICDLQSSYGTRVNQTQLKQPFRLSHSDRIKLGSTRLYFIDLQAGKEQTQKLDVPGLLDEPARTRPPVRPSGLDESARTRPPGKIRPADKTTNQVVRATGTREGQNISQNQNVNQNVDAFIPTPAQLSITICPNCGIANIRSARFCASCSFTLTE